MGYPNVKITNNTAYIAQGDVIYASAFCKNDSYSIPSGQIWEAKSRGVCLVTKIVAILIIDNEDDVEKAEDRKFVKAKDYTSSGTSYSNFEIVGTESEGFEVRRI